MRPIFLSYRRDDAEGEAGRLFDTLTSEFSADNVFMDVAGIEPGQDFRRVIDQNVASCGVLLAMIGRGWIDAKDHAGRRRLDDPLDFVRLETASALKRDIPVIPVLVRGGRMPRPDQLPEDLKYLAYRHAVELTHARWDVDVQLLIKVLRPYVVIEPKVADHADLLYIKGEQTAPGTIADRTQNTEKEKRPLEFKSQEEEQPLACEKAGDGKIETAVFLNGEVVIPEVNEAVAAAPSPLPKLARSEMLRGGPQAPPTSDTVNRATTLKRLREDWIDGVLNQSLYRVARIELGLATRDDVVESPLNAIVQIPDRAPITIGSDTPMTEVFDRLGQSLLILGAPGTGKTTVLLELAKGLLERAEKDPNHPIPAVFNLSTWARKRKPLAKWLISELNTRTGVPKKLGYRWVNEDKVIPLLDGLDEVDATHRRACLDAINEFRREHGLLPIAVCSRSADFEALGKKLSFRGAITVQPLTSQQVSAYLGGSKELAPIQTALLTDASLSDLLETPLMLWVALLAYRQTPVEISKGTTAGERRALLFENFVSAMFKRRAVSAEISQPVAIRQLTWLASSLKRNNQTVFNLEDLDFDWFQTRIQRVVARLAVGICCSVVAGFLFWLVIEVVLAGLFNYGPGLREAVLSWLGIGTIFGLISVSVKLKPKESVGFSFRQLRARIIDSAPSALLVGLTFGIGFLVLLLTSAVESNIQNAIGSIQPAIAATAFGLVAGVGYGLLQVLTTESPESRSAANQGTRNSIITAALVTVVLTPFGGLLGWFLTGTPGLLTLGPGIGISAGLITGGLFAAKHFTLRFLIWVFGGGPFRYRVFLNESVGRLLLYKVGGGYLFVHRMLMDYFISLQVRTKTAPSPAS